MKEPCASSVLHIPYYALYEAVYVPWLQSVDLLLKTMEAPLDVHETAAALNMTEKAVRDAMKAASVTCLDRAGFLAVMAKGESALCRLYRRELECGSPTAYSPADIAYIYQLDERHVADVCKKMGYNRLTATDIPMLLNQIFVYIVEP